MRALAQSLALAGLLLLTLAPGFAFAVTPSEMLADPKLEARARTISAQLRCLVCQNESIDESEATLAHDIRVLVRQRLLAGDTDQQVRDYLVARYGDFILLKPPFKPETYLLWTTPVLLLLAGGVAIAIAARRRTVMPSQSLNDAEAKKLAAVLGKDSA